MVKTELGEIEAALDIMEQAIDDRSSFWVVIVRAHPRFRPLRGHPRFRALLARIWPDEASFRPEAQ